jgi:hypothetical protein
MHLFERNSKGELKSSFEEGMTQMNPATEEDTAPMDSISEYSSTGPSADEDTVTAENWTNLYQSDVDTSLSSPPLDELIFRNVRILEKHIVHVMERRDAEIAIEVAIASSGNVSLADGQTISDQGGGTGAIQITSIQKNELELYVSTIASKYDDVLYHNFEHASHVLGSADSLISSLQQKPKRSNERGISSTNSSRLSKAVGDSDEDDERNHITTFGLSSCPMTHLALVFSALIHDVEHQGVGNKQLVDEQHPLATKYENKSVAENNSIDVAKELLNEDCYSNLRESMFGDPNSVPMVARYMLEKDQELFYSVILGTIQATDICSKDRLDRNKAKWIEAFEDANSSSPSRQLDCYCDSLLKMQNRRSSAPSRLKVFPARTRTLSMTCGTEIPKCNACLLYADECYLQLDFLRASSVLEQMIQAADVAHSMQSWPIFMKWNTKLYDELWAAKLAGRGPDVSANWFKGQIGFFDFYITPLAKRLQQCGVFGEIGGLFLDNLNKNRVRWLQEGEDRCIDMHERVIKQQGNIGC